MFRIPFKWFEFGLHEVFWIPFEWFKFVFECLLERLEFAFKFFQSLSNGLNLPSNVSNSFWLVWIWIRMLRILFKWFGIAFESFESLWFEFEFKCFETLSDGYNSHLNASNPFRMVLILIRILQVYFEWLEFAFECFKLFRMVRIFIRILSIPFECLEFAFPFECLEFAFECFKSLLNLDSNASNPFWMVWMVWSCVRLLWISFKWLEFAYECFEYFESLSNGLNLRSNASNPFRMVTICIRMLWIPFEWVEF